MSPRTGRPKAVNPKSISLHVRLDENDLKILDAYCAQEAKGRAAAVRDGIKLLDGKTKK